MIPTTAEHSSSLSSELRFLKVTYIVDLHTALNYLLPVNIQNVFYCLSMQLDNAQLLNNILLTPI